MRDRVGHGDLDGRLCARRQPTLGANATTAGVGVDVEIAVIAVRFGRRRAYGGVTLSILWGNLAGRRRAYRRPRPPGPGAFESQTVPTAEEEASVVEALSDAAVVAISTLGDPNEVAYDLDCPAVNVYQDGGPAAMLDVVADALGPGDAS